MRLGRSRWRRRGAWLEAGREHGRFNVVAGVEVRDVDLDGLSLGATHGEAQIIGEAGVGKEGKAATLGGKVVSGRHGDAYAVVERSFE